MNLWRALTLMALSWVVGVAWAQQAADGPVPTETALRLRATPMLQEQLPERAQPPSFVLGDRLSGRADLETVIEGNAQLRRPGLTMSSQMITHDNTTDIVTFHNQVRVNSKGDRYTAESGQLQMDAFRGYFLQPSYQFLATGGHGQAERLDVVDRDRISLLKGNYTTCLRREEGDWRPDWILEADRLDIDREEDEGYAEGAVLRFKGVPLMPLPSMSFPLSSTRRSGWLPPTLGLDNKSGLDLAVPYYWNIAPNRDATITPELMQRRGANVMAEFRYLEDNYSGSVNASYMPEDHLRHRQRWSAFVRHTGLYDIGVGSIGLSLNLNRVSDDDYWQDFTRSGISQTTRLLANDASLNWGRGDFSFVARALKWQTLQDVDAPIVPPYGLSQLVGRWARSNERGFDYSVEADFTHFQGVEQYTRQPNADRAVMRTQLSHPFLRSWGFLIPTAQLHASAYRFDRALSSGEKSVSRVLPTLSLDSGLVFEREASYFGRAFNQTLEPRLKYVYTPYREQNYLPNYDSGQYDFNFSTIWAENAFAGDDRVVDNNLVTGGLTTRLLDHDSGAELVRFAMAQRYRFSAQRVILPGGTPIDKGWSDIMLGAGINWDPRWAFETVVQYNHDTQRSTRTTFHGRWTPGPYRTISAAYRYQRDLNSESIDVGWQWPLSALWRGDRSELGSSRLRRGNSCQGAWYTMGRINYNLVDKKIVDGIIGFEYDAGCWVGRIVLEQINNSITSATRRIMFQLELNGLSRVGSNLMSTLRNNVPRYMNLREQYVPPSRFTTYD